MNNLQSFQNVFYPPVGIAHITQDIADLVRPHVNGKTSIIINTSSQPNSHPHLGTLTTMMTAFAIANHLQASLSIPVRVVFDALENGPGEKKECNGIIYQKNLDSVPSQTADSLAMEYLESFRHLFEFLTQVSDIAYDIQLYRQFQALPAFRQNLVHILNRFDEFAPVISPSEKRIRVRFPCPKCQFSDKGSKSVRILESSTEQVQLESRCFEHGAHHITIRQDSEDYVDTNTPLRSALKGAVFAEQMQAENILIVMVDGGDWAGTWASSVFFVGTALLGYTPLQMPIRFYAPVICDWSGAKFSKSLYVKSGSYQYLPEALVNYDIFRTTYGDKGLQKLWKEVQAWVSDPRKFFRNYSMDYFDLVLNS